VIDRLIVGHVIDTTQRRGAGSMLLPFIEALSAAGVPIRRTMGSIHVTDDLGECWFRLAPVYDVGDIGRQLLSVERERLLCEI